MTNSSSQSDGAHAFVLKATIDADEIARVDGALKAALLHQLLADRARRMARADILRRFGWTSAEAANIAKWLSVAGMVMALAFTVTGGLEFHGQRADLVFELFFATMIAWWSVVPRAMAWMHAPWQAYWHHFASVKANSLLKKARAIARFEARYEFQDDSVAYFRSVGGHAEFAWRRRLHGLRVSGAGFTLLYKKPTSRFPYAIFLHQPSTQFDELLDGLAVRPMAPQI